MVQSRPSGFSKEGVLAGLRQCLGHPHGQHRAPLESEPHSLGQAPELPQRPRAQERLSLSKEGSPEK